MLARALAASGKMPAASGGDGVPSSTLQSDPGAAPQLIKRSIALRAKHRLHQDIPGPTYQLHAPGVVVPHPRNRAGDPVKSLRTKQLIGDSAQSGCDPFEANSNAVAVFEAEESRVASSVEWESYQKDFEERSN